MIRQGYGERGTGNGGGRARSLFPIPRSLIALLLACASPEPGGELVRVTIPPGSGFRAVTDTLAAHGLTGSRLWFRALARVRGIDRAVKAGVYDLPAGAGAWVVLDQLQQGKVAMARLTVPEGLTLVELASLADARLDIPADSVLAQARDSGRLRQLAVAAPTLEGYLLPETYNLPLPVTADGLVQAMADEFTRRWNPAWDRRLDSLHMTRAELITLASIVEGEARHDDERATIAGVYTNRLRRGMLLQADPTVQYAVQVARGERKPRLFFKDLEIDSPYNTYVHAGLPPGPVNSPGLKSIQAALYPTDVPYLYFVAGPDGHHVFSRTLAEHNHAIMQVRRLAGSAP